MKVAITGATGMLGSELMNVLGKDYEVAPFPPSAELDISNIKAVREFLEAIRPEVIVHAAAIRDLDRLEQNPELAWKVNCVATWALAVTARDIGSVICYISTDNVFDGTKGEAYHEFDLTCPINIYGRTKEASERIVKDICERYFILRVPLLFGRYGRPENNLLIQLFSRVNRGEVVLAAGDQWSSVCECRDVALAVAQIIATSQWGTYHVTGPGEVSRAGLLRKALALAGKDPFMVREVSSAALRRPAKRPRYTVLTSLLVETVFGLTLPHWEEALERCVKDLKQAGLVD